MIRKIVQVAAVGLLVGSNYAAAQVASTPSQGNLSLEEIVVTAERRETNLQDTPVSIISMSAEQIEQTGANCLDELSAFVPNLSINFDGSYGKANPEFSIRGIGSGVSSAGAVTERPVGLYIDGIYFARVQGSLLSLVDAGQIDVLRGPQGTLFGRNTTGGAIAYTSTAPSRDQFGSLKIKVGDFAQRAVQLMYNMPVGDETVIRASGAITKQDGYVQRRQYDLGNVDDRIARLQLTSNLTPDLSIDLTATTSQTSSNGDARDVVGIDLGGTGSVRATFRSVEVLLANAGEGPIVQDDPRWVLDDYTVPDYCFLDDINPYTWGSECDTKLSASMDVFTSKLVWDINGDMTLTSISGVLQGDQVSNSDWVWTGAYNRPFSMEYRNIQQEFQFNWDTDRMNLVAGVVYFQEHAVEREITTELSSTGAFAISDVDLLAGRQITRRSERYQSDVDSFGIYSQGTYALTDRLDVTAGVRYSSDVKDINIRYYPVADDPRDRTGGGDENWSDVDWRLATTYNFSDDIMFYASVTDAYKAGIADDSSLERANNVNSIILFIEPEYAQGFEIGARTEWLDRRLRLNLTAYRTDYTNRQSSTLITDPISGVPVIQSINLGDVQYEGLEGDIAFALTNNLTINGSVAFSEYERADNPGGPLENVPKSGWTFGAVYGLELEQGASIDSSLTYGWVDSQFSSAGAAPVENPSYGTLSGRFKYSPAAADWSIAVFGTNLLDENYSTSTTSQAFHSGGGGRAVISEYRARPRSLGIEMAFNF